MINSDHPNNLAIKKLKYTSRITQKLHGIVNPNISDINKRAAIRKLIDFSGCCVCDGVPAYELIYQLESAKRIERYCNRCYKKREESDSIDPKEYFVIVPSVSHYKP